jgi:uncharacterized membrane protein YcaP (DUF421 family)
MHIDWAALFSINISVLEIFIRGTVIYLSLFILLRVILKREAGELGITDLLMVVLLADAAQNAMSGQYKSITEGILLVSTIIFWNFMLNWVGYRIPVVQRFIHPPSLLLVKNGVMLRKNMNKELLTKEELLGLLREQGIDDVRKVKEARMESDGRISAIQFQPEEQQGEPGRPSV